MSAAPGEVMLSAAADYVALRERLYLTELRELLWKTTALRMRAHTNVVGVRLLQQAVKDEEELR